MWYGPYNVEWGGRLESAGPRRFTWLPSLFFLPSVGGNLAASTDIERAVFTPVALLLALLSIRLALKN